MLSPKITELLAEIEKLPLDKQESFAEIFAIEIKEANTPPITLDDLMAELDADIATGDIYDLDTLLA
jgi:hypothetical protein